MKINVLKINFRIKKIFCLIEKFLKKSFFLQNTKFFFCYYSKSFSISILRDIFLFYKLNIKILQLFIKGLKIKNIKNFNSIINQSFARNLLYKIESFYFLINKQHFYISAENYSGLLLEIHSSVGGPDSNSWTNMLMNMYKKWLLNKKIVFFIINYNAASTGIKSVIFRIDDSSAYIFLKKEVGLHKLVRISPFDNKSKRHTTFSEVVIHPLSILHNNINYSDLRIDTYKSSGSGGQHVNTTDSAVRIKHIPSNIVVSCQDYRSQHKNKKICMDILREKLYMLAKKKQKIFINPKKLVRCYTLHPYQMVKDYISLLSTTNVSSVLQGNIDPFIYN